MSSFIYLMRKKESKECQDNILDSITIEKHIPKNIGDKNIDLILEGLYSDTLVKWIKIKGTKNKFRYRLDDEVIKFLICLYRDGAFPSFVVRFESGELLFDKSINSYVNISNLKKIKITTEELLTQTLEESVRYIIAS